MTKEKDKSHLRVVGKDAPDNKNNEEDKSVLSSIALYDAIADELSELYHSNWHGCVKNDMGREDFVRTVLECDDLDFVHPVIVYDSAPAPTANKPMLTPEKYGILDLSLVGRDEEDTLLWTLECAHRDYRIVFMPKKAEYKIEKQIQNLIKMIIDEIDDNIPDEFNPSAVVAFIRELRIAFNNEAMESGFMDDDDFDDDFDDGLYDEDDYEDEEFSQEDIDMLDRKVDERMDSGALAKIDLGRYQSILFFS